MDEELAAVLRDRAPGELEKPGEIEHIDFVVVRLPFVHPFATSAATWTCKEAFLLRLEARSAPKASGRGDGIIAWGECVADPDPFYAYETTSTTAHIIKDFLLPLVEPDLTIGEILEAFRHVRGHGMAKATVENALLDLAAFPDLALMVDANGDYGLGDAEHLAELDAFGLTMIEQPLSYSDIYQHSILQKRLKTALCLDESILGLDDAVTAIALGACRVINIKQGRVGGLIESRRIARYAALKGVPCWSGGMDETGIGRAANIHLQTDPDFSIPGDTAETARYFYEDLVEPPVTLGPGGWISVPSSGPGIGVEVQADRLDRLTIERHRIK